MFQARHAEYAVSRDEHDRPVGSPQNVLGPALGKDLGRLAVHCSKRTCHGVRPVSIERLAVSVLGRFGWHVNELNLAVGQNEFSTEFIKGIEQGR